MKEVIKILSYYALILIATIVMYKRYGTEWLIIGMIVNTTFYIYRTECIHKKKIPRKSGSPIFENPPPPPRKKEDEYCTGK